jgi:hypothetical protein
MDGTYEGEEYRRITAPSGRMAELPLESVTGEPRAVASARDVRSALSDSDAFTPAWVDQALDALPWVLLGLLLAFEMLVVYSHAPLSSYLIWPSALVAAAIVAVLLRLLNEKVPVLLATIWHRQLLQSRTPKHDVTHEFAEFVKETQRSLNRKGNWLWGILFVAMLNAAFNDELGRFWDFTWIDGDWRVLVPGVAVLTALLLGFFAGRMVAIARCVQQLGIRFELNMQRQHPDRSGGLLPVGELCLINALILIVPAIHLGIWILLLQGSNLSLVYASMIPILLALAALVFFRPLESVHRAMIRSGGEMRVELDALSLDIDQLARQQLRVAAAQRTDEVKELDEKLGSLRRTYEENRDIPKWPFDGAILVKFITSMVIPIIGLVTSLGFRIWN